MLSAGRGRRRRLLTVKHRGNSSSCRGTFSRVHSVITRHRSTVCRRRTVDRTLMATLSFVGVPSASKLGGTLRDGGAAGVGRRASGLGTRTSGCFTSIPFPRMRQLMKGGVLRACTKCVPRSRRVNVFGMVSDHFGKGGSTFVSTYFGCSVFNSGRGFGGFVTRPALGGLSGS